MKKDTSLVMRMHKKNMKTVKMVKKSPDTKKVLKKILKEVYELEKSPIKDFDGDYLGMMAVSSYNAALDHTIQIIKYYHDNVSKIQ